MEFLSKAGQQQIIKLQQKKYRDQSATFFAEGFRALTSALQSAPENILRIVVNESILDRKQFTSILEEAQKLNLPVFQLADRDFKKISDASTASGLLFTCKKPGIISLEEIAEKARYLVYLERIADPGNLGTIIRSASWFGIDALLLSPESVDPFNPKVVRSTAGTIFDVNIVTNIGIDELETIVKPCGFQFCATLPANEQHISDWNPKEKTMVLLGPEAHGLSKDAIHACDAQITITGRGKAESLNLSVAAGIVFYEMTNQKIKQG